MRLTTLTMYLLKHTDEYGPHYLHLPLLASYWIKNNLEEEGVVCLNKFLDILLKIRMTTFSNPKSSFTQCCGYGTVLGKAVLFQIRIEYEKDKISDIESHF
jgi:hypothetical protein